ncbi:MAG: hypothetical protein WC455_13195 [Dehalococcoidia bacterium]|jgi:hypothetical protein
MLGSFVRAIFMGAAAAIGFFTVAAIKDAWGHGSGDDFLPANDEGSDG